MTVGPVRIETLEPAPLAVVRRQAARGDLSRLVPECCGLVWNALRAQDRRGGRHVAVYLDDSIRVEIGVELAADFTETADLVRSWTPAGPAAWTTHFGPYGGLGAAHRAILDWCAANGRTPAGPNWEIYGHWLKAWDDDPRLIRTDVFYQLAPI